MKALSPFEAQRSRERVGIADCLGIMQENRDKDVYPQMAALMRTGLAKCVLYGYLSADEYEVIAASFDEPAGPSVVTFGRGALEFKVDAPITNNTTVRPIIDMTARDKEVVRDRAGNVVGVRSVDRLP